LATYGSDLTNAAWNPLSAFIGGTAVGPDGTLSAVKLVASAGSGFYPRFRRLSLLTDTTQTFSIYVKPLEFQHLAISADGNTSCMVRYNLSGSGGITSATGATGTVEQCGNGWFRVSFSYTTTPSIHLAITMQSSTTYQTETGNAYDGMLFAMAQLENQSSSSSYISTTSSTATRAADSCSVDLSKTDYSGGEGSLVCDLSINVRSGGWGVSIGTNNNDYYMVGQFSATTEYLIYSELNNSAQVAIYQSMTSIGPRKIAGSWATNDVSACIDGGSVTTDTSNAIPSMSKIMIGQNFTGTNSSVLNGHVKRVALYNVTLSDTELQALTS
jgi:hypothetical protein